MTLEQFIPLALVTEDDSYSVIEGLLTETGRNALHPARGYFHQRKIRLLHATMGICTEVGEMIEEVRRSKFTKGAVLNKENMFEELGDAFWYTAIFRDEFDDAILAAGTAAVRSRSRNKLGGMLRDLTVASAALLDVSKKNLFYDRGYSDQIIVGAFIEVEKVLYDLCDRLGFDPGEVRAGNIRKLTARYGGSFSTAAANNRDIAAELDALGFVGK